MRSFSGSKRRHSPWDRDSRQWRDKATNTVQGEGEMVYTFPRRCQCQEKMIHAPEVGICLVEPETCAASHALVVI